MANLQRQLWWPELFAFELGCPERDNVNDHRAAAIDLQAEKAARPAAPCASYCYHAIIEDQALPSAIHSTDVPVGHHQVCETTLLVWRLGAKPLVRTRYLTRIVDTEIWV